MPSILSASSHFPIPLITYRLITYKQASKPLCDRCYCVALQLEERLRANEELAELFQKRYDAASKTVGDLKTAVTALFQRLGCGTPAVRALLGDAGVTDGNLLACVSVVEQRVAEAMRVYAGALARSGQDADHLRVPLGQVRFCKCVEFALSCHPARTGKVEGHLCAQLAQAWRHFFSFACSPRSPLPGLVNSHSSTTAQQTVCCAWAGQSWHDHAHTLCAWQCKYVNDLQQDKDH